jgi:cupin superfamily acireductone dioxygenase involved in methionine salvage
MTENREGMKYWDKICSLRHYGFIHSSDNSRVLKAEGIGNWIDKYEAQEIVSEAEQEVNDLRRSNSYLISALIAITNSGPDAIPIKEAFEMAHRAIERATGGKV